MTANITEEFDNGLSNAEQLNIYKRQGIFAIVVGLLLIYPVTRQIKAGNEKKAAIADAKSQVETQIASTTVEDAIEALKKEAAENPDSPRITALKLITQKGFGEKSFVGEEINRRLGADSEESLKR